MHNKKMYLIIIGCFILIGYLFYGKYSSKGILENIIEVIHLI